MTIPFFIVVPLMPLYRVNIEKSLWPYGLSARTLLVTYNVGIIVLQIVVLALRIPDPGNSNLLLGFSSPFLLLMSVSGVFWVRSLYVAEFVVNKQTIWGRWFAKFEHLW